MTTVENNTPQHGLDPTRFTMLPNVLLTDPAISEKLGKWSGRDWLVYLCLLAHRNAKTGEAFPSMQTIAKDCHVSESTVLRAVKRFRVDDLITTTRRPTGRRGRVNVYRFVAVDLWEELNALTDRQHRDGRSSATNSQHSDGQSRATDRQISRHLPSNPSATNRQHVDGATDSEEQTEQRREPLRSLEGERLAGEDYGRILAQREQAAQMAAEAADAIDEGKRLAGEFLAKCPQTDEVTP